MENLEEINRIILALNYKVPRDVLDKEFYKLIKRGFKITNIWKGITSFKTEKEYVSSVGQFIKPEHTKIGMKYVHEILEFRNLKEIAISQMYYSYSKEYYDLEVQAMKDLLLYLRNGRTDVFYLLNEKVIDKLSPHLHRFN